MSSDAYVYDCLPGVSLREPANSVTALEKAEDSFSFDTSGGVYGRTHFESADTDRLNEAHWQFAYEQPINDVLNQRLPTIRARATFETDNNPTLEGLVLQHTLATIGEDGPLADLQGEDDETDEWCEQAMQVWESWCRVADASGSLTLAGILKKWNVGGWYAGEWLWRKVNERPEHRRADVPHVRLMEIEPQRLMTPPDATGDDAVSMGVRRNQFGRPTSYWISHGWQTLHFGGAWVSAAVMMHGFDRVQAKPGQARGVPWSQSGLPTAADSRDYDTQVLDAARVAADNAVFAFTAHEDAEFTENVPKHIAWRRRNVNFMAPGWQPMVTQPGHPGANYTDHRQELHGDLGKPKGVPSMITRIDARDHNYSSARFDYLLLGESAKHLQATLYNPQLRGLFDEVIGDAILMRLLPPPPRGRMTLEWVWDAQPEVDEKKAADAEGLYLANGTQSLSRVVARRHGRRMRDVIRARERDDRLLRDAGLPTVAESTRRGAGNAASRGRQSNASAETNETEE